MILESEFRADAMMDVKAAAVGIHRDRWVGIPRSLATADHARAEMAQYRFDVLPIIDDGPVIDYFCTVTWGDYRQVSQRPISPTDTIRFDTSLREVIREFDRQTRHFFFLTDHEDTVVGLISLVNLNCRQVRVYLYNFLAHLEIGLANFIRSRRNDEQLLALELTGQSAAQFQEAKKQYRADLRKGIEAPFLEYVYLWELIKVVLKERLYQELGCTNDDFRQCQRINELRKRIAHPTRSLVSKISDAHLIASALEASERILPKLGEA